jgi:phosphoribosyl 1,2-cyclic phosphodiesterase
MSFALRFLGVGSAQAVELGSSGAVLERNDAPVLLIDCGPETLSRYLDTYGDAPRAVYITHTHMDHVAGLERLFYRAYFDAALKGNITLFAHAALISHLQSRVADYPSVIAEGGANFWDAFKLIPCSRGFWHQGFWFDVFPTRHHAPQTSFGVALRNAFAWTGDTRPIPEMLTQYAPEPTVIAHDCALHGNPSHTGVDDLEHEYTKQQRAQMFLYHYGSAADGEALIARGYHVAQRGQLVPLQDPSMDVVLEQAVGAIA